VTAATPQSPGAPVAFPPDIVVPPKRRRLKWPEHPVRTAIYLALLIGCTIIFIYPFIWMVSASFKPRNYVFDNKLIPTHFQPANYKYVFTGPPEQPTNEPVGRWIWNSFYIATLAAVTVTISSALVAFGFAYFRFPLRNFLFALVLGSMMLPTAVTMIPVYLIWNHVGTFTSTHSWLPHIGVGTTYPLWLSNIFGAPFYIFLMRQFFLGIPRSLFEASRMDGDNYFSMFRRIGIPLAWPALIVTFIFEFKANWMGLLGPLIYLRSDSQFTIPRGLYALLGVYGPSAGGHGDYEVIIAAMVIATLPLIVLFFVGQKYFIEQGGLATQGRKG
jgi:multiple sugar transport system permease protein